MNKTILDRTDPDYDDWIMVLEYIYTIPWASLGVKLKLCQELFQQYPGLPGWSPPSDEKLTKWIEEARKNWESNNAD